MITDETRVDANCTSEVTYNTFTTWLID